ncbi:MAG: hypothetical protein LBR26_17375, partial [Prevotella sp.]|nr:hypothetical protein [Prevotella sp.]
ATISFGELGVDGYGPDITVPKPKVFEPVAVVWSQSNVYFEDTETAGDGIGVLTFAESNTPLDKNLYQGVFFKWGSLIGVSTDNSFSSSSLFIPDLSTGKYHRVAVSSLAGHVDLTDVVGLFKKRLTDLGVSNFANYSDIYAKLPYVTQADMTGDVPVKIPTLSGASYVDDNGLTAASGTALYDTYRGDICKYLADKNSASGNSLTKGTWRLPTSREFGNGGTNYSDGSSFSDPAPGDYDTQWNKDYSGTPGSFAADINGAGELDKNSTENWYYTLVRWIFDPAKDNLSTTPSFPASGYRNDNDGGLGGVGSLGYYWSTSVSNDAAYVLNLRFVSGNVNPYSSNYRTGGNSVRCVRDGENVAP